MVVRKRTRGVPAGVEPSADRIDVYVRMNEDNEKDYCFNVSIDAPVSSLYKIFDTLPIKLTPSYFFYDRPDGFNRSVHPGYLTAEGALLFTRESDKKKWLRLMDSNARIGDELVEGQLVVPNWKPHKRRETLAIIFLLLWLYLDLPEFISPTPGTAPSKWMLKAIRLVAPAPDLPNPETSLFYNKWWQLGFFAIHIVKVVFIYLILWNGFWNPATMNPLARYRDRKKRMVPPTREELMELGWTGARRMASENWPDKYRQHRIDRAGGVLEAFNQGLLTKPVGFTLNEGEGWNVLAKHGGIKALRNIKVGRNFLNAKGQFVVSAKYFATLAKPLANRVKLSETASDIDEVKLVKQFREYGYLDGPRELEELYDDVLASKDLPPLPS